MKYAKHMKDVLKYHLIMGMTVDAATTLTLSDLVETANSGENLTFANTMTAVIVEDALMRDSMVAVPDMIINDSNILHVIDAIYAPSRVGTSISEVVVSGPDNLSILLELLKAANLKEVLFDKEASFCVFAPKNVALKAFFTDFVITQKEA